MGTYHIHSCLHLTVHPIPMCQGKEGTEWEHPKLYHPHACTSHSNVPWNRGAKLYHPSCLHPTAHPVPWEGRNGVGTSQTVPHTLMPASHCPPCHGKEGTEWEHPKLYHPQACPSHPNVPWNRVAKLYHPSCLHPTTHPIPMYHGIEWPNCTTPRACIPMYHGIEWPNCTTPHACIPLPILYHGTEGMEWEHHKLYHIHSCLSTPSQCAMGKKGQWEHPKLYHPHGTSQTPMPESNYHGKEGEHPKLYHPPCLSTPSQCTMGRKGHIPNCTTSMPASHHHGNIPNCTTPHACIPCLHPTVHPCTTRRRGQSGSVPLNPTVHHIPMYHGKELELYHPSCLYRNGNCSFIQCVTVPRK